MDGFLRKVLLVNALKSASKLSKLLKIWLKLVNMTRIETMILLKDLYFYEIIRKF